MIKNTIKRYVLLSLLVGLTLTGCSEKDVTSQTTATYQQIEIANPTPIFTPLKKTDASSVSVTSDDIGKMHFEWDSTKITGLKDTSDGSETINFIESGLMGSNYTMSASCGIDLLKDSAIGEVGDPKACLSLFSVENEVYSTAFQYNDYYILQYYWYKPSVSAAIQTMYILPINPIVDTNLYCTNILYAYYDTSISEDMYAILLKAIDSMTGGDFYNEDDFLIAYDTMYNILKTTFHYGNNGYYEKNYIEQANLLNNIQELVNKNNEKHNTQEDNLNESEKNSNNSSDNTNNNDDIADNNIENSAQDTDQ